MPDQPARDDPQIADAADLFRDAPARPRPAAKPAVGATGEVFDVIGGPEGAAAPAAPGGRPAAPQRVARPSPAPEAHVDQLWSRAAEWGQTLVILSGVALVTLLVFGTAISMGAIALALFALLVGAAALVVLSYPIVITLEVPVRMTPEQAVRDYYAALSHHLPHYRRMWLLLSTPARACGEYGSLEGFKAYWKRRLAQIRAERIAATTPLVFEITDWLADPSAAKQASQAQFVVVVRARGRHGEPPLASIPVRIWTVRGPDNMWYLNDGRLP
jgi:hypothetical protein